MGAMTSLRSLVQRLLDNPVLLGQAVTYVVMVAAWFGLHLDAEALAGAFVFVSTIFGLVARSQVVPLRKLKRTSVGRAYLDRAA